MVPGIKSPALPQTFHLMIEARRAFYFQKPRIPVSYFFANTGGVGWGTRFLMGLTVLR
jgi:hypothetical protein